ncbi:MAG TPA: glycine oxidase ThiO [Longimicrobiales bacterium]|nr:glycine oxidase ThiO [Longimicrobiales bacterium]
MTTPDVIVVGAGIIGCAVARELARRDRTVLVVERDSPGRRATWAAAGMLSPLGEAGGGGPFLELADESLNRYARFAEELQAESGIDVEYRTDGKLHVAFADDDTELHALAVDPLAARFDASLMGAAEARHLEPALADDIRTALLVKRDHRVNNRLLAQALLGSAVSAGVRFRTANPVAGLLSRDGYVTGVRLTSGEQINAPDVVLAAGAWSAQLAGLPRPLPVRPVKGQMFAVDSRADVPGQVRLRHVIAASDCYIIPRDDGRILVGATVEDAGFRRGPTPRGIGILMAAAARVVPALADLPLVETWAGFRPATPDNLPIIGADPSLRGLTYATGHYRNGILLAPVTAWVVAELITHGRTQLDVTPFQVTRFQHTQ